MDPKPNPVKRPPMEDESRYQIHSRVAIGFILRSAMQAGEMVSAHFNEGRDSFVTALLAVDPATGVCVVDASTDDALNTRMCNSSRISFVSRQDKIKIRWEVPRARMASFEERPAIKVPMPDSLLKFQRREFFRAETPVMRPVRCALPLPEKRRLDVNLFDISLGGVGLTGFPDSFVVDVGQELKGCTITLPEVGVLSVTLQVRNVTETVLRDGRVTRRVGCMFIGLAAGADTIIQRYIIRLERERRSKLE